MKERTKRLWIEAAAALLIFALLLSVTIPGFLGVQCVPAIENAVESIANRLSQDEKLRLRLSQRLSLAHSAISPKVVRFTADDKPPSLDDILLPDCPYPIVYQYDEYNDYFIVFAIVGESEYSEGIRAGYSYGVFSDDDGYMKARFKLPRYDPSNGIESEGVIYRDSYDLGWRNR